MVNTGTVNPNTLILLVIENGIKPIIAPAIIPVTAFFIKKQINQDVASTMPVL